MSISHISLKQKNSRSSIHYFFKRSLSYFTVQSTGRKRRLFIASVIAFSGILLHHSPLHSSGRHHSHPTPSVRNLPKNQQSSITPYYAHSPTIYLVGALLLALSGASRRSDSIKNDVSVLFVRTQGIRGSPQPLTTQPFLH
jgi:hypothetical protein